MIDQLRRSATDAKDAETAAGRHVADLQHRLHELTRPESITLNSNTPARFASLHDETKQVRQLLAEAETHLAEAQAYADAEAQVLEAATRAANHPAGCRTVNVPKVSFNPQRLSAIREQISDLKSQRGRLDRSPPSRAEALADLRHQVVAMAEPPSLNPHGRLILPHNAAAMMAWLDPDLIVAKIEQTLHIPDGISEEDKADQRSTLTSLLLTAETEEEALVRAGRASGLRISRRPDANPRCVLGETVKDKEHAAA
jgi:hypothetical protein